MEAGQQIDYVKPGDEFRASQYNALVDQVKRLSRLQVDGAEAYDLPGGQGIVPEEKEWIYARVTAESGSGAGAQFSWTEQYPAAGGTWRAGPRSGTPARDPAYEINGQDPTNFPFNAVLRRSVTSGQWLFQYRPC
jgi:hypothetical protein